MSGRIKKLDISPEAFQSLEQGDRNGEAYCFQIRRMSVLLEAKGLSVATAGYSLT